MTTGFSSGIWPSVAFPGSAVRGALAGGARQELDRPTQGLFVAGTDVDAVTVTLIPTRRHLELRDHLGLLVAAWAWGDVIRRDPTDGRGPAVGRPSGGLPLGSRPDVRLRLTCRLAPTQRVDVLDETPLSETLARGRIPTPVAAPVRPDPLRPDGMDRWWLRYLDLVDDLWHGGRRWLRRVVGGGGRFHSWPGLRRVVTAGLGALATAMVGIVLLLALPGVANRLGDWVPAGRDATWGGHLARSVIAETGRPACTAPQGQAVLAALARRLAQGLPPRWPIRLYVVRDLRPQALALPGGHLVIFEGLLRDSRSADAVAGMLAVLIAQSHLRQGGEAVVRADGLPALVALMLGDWDSPHLSLARYLAVQTGRPEAEARVDALALDLVQRAGLRGRGLALFRDQVAEEARFGTTLDPRGEDVTLVAGGTASRAWAEGLVALRSPGPELAAFARRHPVTADHVKALRQVPRGGDLALSDADWAALAGLCLDRDR